MEPWYHLYLHGKTGYIRNLLTFVKARSVNAILLCAGTGNRFQPASFSCPKPLTPINGVPIVERTLQLLRAGGVDRITMVVGYRAEDFAYLREKYGVEQVLNPDYAGRNNYASLLLVADRLDGSLIIDGDVFFLRDVLPHVKTDRSQFVVQPTLHGLEWEVFADKAGKITDVKKWTSTGYSMAGLSYWTGEAAGMLARELCNCRPDDYWEDAVLRLIPGTPIYATYEKEPYLQEMDTIMDAVHYQLLSHEEVAHLCSIDYQPVRMKSLTNSTWLVRNHEGQKCCLRIPGRGTEKYIQRDIEPQVIDLIKDLHVTPEARFYPGGLKATPYMHAHRIANAEDFGPPFFGALAEKLRRMHTIRHDDASPLQPMYITDQILKFEKIFDGLAPRKVEPQQRHWIMEKARAFDNEPQVLCHRDLAPENILVKDHLGTDLLLIDFEYAGFTNPLWEIASFILESDMNEKSRLEFAAAYGITSTEELTRLLEMEILVDYVWGMWGFISHYLDYSENKFKRLLRKLYSLGYPCLES